MGPPNLPSTGFSSLVSSVCALIRRVRNGSTGYDKCVGHFPVSRSFTFEGLGDPRRGDVVVESVR